MSPANAQSTPSATPPGPAPQLVGAVTGIRQRIAFFSTVNPDCSARGTPALHFLRAPLHGSAEAVTGRDFPNFTAGSQRAACNQNRTPGTLIYYTSLPGYTGQDSLSASIIFADGARVVMNFAITVETDDVTGPDPLAHGGRGLLRVVLR